MKTFNYLTFIILAVLIAACDVNNDLDEITADPVVLETPTSGTVDFSNYVAIGASFSAGFTDNALFISGQENSFPNIMAKQMEAMGGSTTFNQPLMADNIGGMLLNGTQILNPRLYFNGSGPTVLDATPTTEATMPSTNRPFNNFGVPGAKSFHLTFAGYANANPYFGRMASSPTATVLADAAASNPTFFTVSEVGGNDVLGYALSGGTGVDQTGNTNPNTYGDDDITDPNVFAATFTSIVNTLSANGAKGALVTIPYITNLSHFTTVPHNPVSLDDQATADQANTGYAVYNAGIQQAFAILVANTPLTQEQADAEIARRTISFSVGENAVVILDEDLTDLTGINPGLINMRQATSDDLLVLPSSSFIGTNVGGNPALVNGVSVPLADRWVLTPEEQTAIRNATDSYNNTIIATANASDNLVVVELNDLLTAAANGGYPFDTYSLNTDLVTGGLISLDGVHLTSRGYALMANEILKAMDGSTGFGTNFEASGNLAKADDHPTNYSPTLPNP